MSLVGWIVVALALPIVVVAITEHVRSARGRRLRDRPDRAAGGDSFADTSYWGGWGRPGS